MEFGVDFFSLVVPLLKIKSFYGPYYFPLFFSWSISELRMRLAPWNRFKPSTDHSKAVLLLWMFCVFCVLRSRLFIAALWSPAWKGQTYMALVGGVYCIFVTFPCGILGWVWYLIVSFLIFAISLTLIFIVNHLLTYKCWKKQTLTIPDQTASQEAKCFRSAALCTQEAV